MRHQIDLGLDDFVVTRRYAVDVHRAALKQRRWRHVARNVLIFGLLGTIFGGVGWDIRELAGWFLSGNGWWATAYSLAVLVLAIAVGFWWQRSPARVEAWLKGLAGPIDVEVTPEGFTLRSARATDYVRWSQVLALDETPTHWMLHLAPRVIIGLPKTAWPADGGTAFADELRERWAADPVHAGRPLPAQPVALSWRALWADRLGANVAAGAKLAVGRAVTLGDFRVGPWQVVWLLLAGWGINTLALWVVAGAHPAVDAYALLVELASFASTVFAALVVATQMGTPSRLVRTLVVTLAAALPSLTALNALRAVWDFLPTALTNDGWGIGLWALLLLWSFWALAQAFLLVYRLAKPASWQLAAVYMFVGCFAVAPFLHHELIYKDRDEKESADMARWRSVNAEDTFYRQPALVDAAVEAVATQRPGQTDFYFVGFAGQAREAVFANDVRLAQSTLDQHYGTAGRSIALLNSFDTVQSQPVASVHNLERTLGALAKRMDVDEDVLVLFLTSHGGSNQRLSVEFWPLRLNELSATELRSMLDASGIRHRIIIVSACYSGGFIAPLQDEHTLIMTASRADHVSYGCGDYTQYTYFTQALFAESMGPGVSFVQAFEHAREQEAAREQREGKDPSGPQLFVGAAMAERLGVPATLPPLPRT